MINSRTDINICAKRLVIKAGTSTLSTPDGYVNITNVANIVEHISRLHIAGKEVQLLVKIIVN